MPDTQIAIPENASGPDQWTILLHDREIAHFRLPEGSRLTINRECPLRPDDLIEIRRVRIRFT